MLLMPRGLGEAIVLLVEICHEFNVSAIDVRGYSYLPKFVMIRREYCKRGRAKGIGDAALGATIGRDRTTVVYNANEETFLRKRANRPKGPRR